MGYCNNKFIFMHIFVPLLLATLVFLLFDMTDFDITISNALYDESTKEFFWINNKLVEVFLHKGARYISGAVAMVATGGALFSMVRPAYMRLLPNQKIPRLLDVSEKYQRDLFYIWIAMAIGTGLFTHSLKTETNIYCPVQTVLYGGKMLYAKWWAFPQYASENHGNCWPGGHAAGAFSLFVLYFVALRHRWRYAAHAFFTAAALGLFLGTVRVLQGWHFMSHTLWAGLYMWLACLIVALLFYGEGSKKHRVLCVALVFLVTFGTAYLNAWPVFHSFMVKENIANGWLEVFHFIWAGNFLWLSLSALALLLHGNFAQLGYCMLRTEKM